MTKARHIAIAILTTTAATLAANATTFTWIQGGGPWNEANRWTPTGIPDAGDLANVNVLSGISFGADMDGATIGGVRIGPTSASVLFYASDPGAVHVLADDLEVNDVLDSFTIRELDMTIAGDALLYGTDVSVEGPSRLEIDDLWIDKGGASNDIDASLTLDGADIEVVLSERCLVGLREGPGVGTLDLLNGASLHADDCVLIETGHLNILGGSTVSADPPGYGVLVATVGSSGLATLTISGAGSSLETVGGVNVGRTDGREGRILITDSGRLTCVASAAGNQVGRFGRIDVESGGRLELDDDISVGGTVCSANGGVVTVPDDVTVSITGIFLENGSFVVSGALGQTFRVNNGGLLECDTWCAIGATAGETGTVELDGLAADGTRSTFRNPVAGHDLTIASRGTAVVEAIDGGLVDFGDDTIIGQHAGSDGLARIQGVAMHDGAPVRSEMRVTRNGSGSRLFVGDAGAGALEILDGALVDVADGAWIARLTGSDGGLLVAGAAEGYDATLDVGGTLHIGGASLTNFGHADVTIGDGGWVRGRSAVNVWPDTSVCIEPGGRLQVGNHFAMHEANVRVDGTLLVGATFVNEGGTLAGSGTINVKSTFDNNGTISPGASPGILNVVGGCTLGPTSNVVIEIAGPEAGTQYDRLAVGGILSAQGTLDVRFIDGYEPVGGEQFSIIEAGTFTGTFDDVLVEGADVDINVDGGGVVVEALDNCPADIDGSGAVDFGDILAILGAWGSNGGPEDLSNNGVVDFSDLLIVLGTWGPCP